jgi:hypothetical protein
VSPKCQQYLSQRKSLVDLLFETGKRLRQTQSTCFLAVSYMDLILNSQNLISELVDRKSFKVIALVCLNIASKFDALDLNTPLLNELMSASN